jgi:hypothetical protein
VRGITREVLCAALATHHDQPPSLSALSNEWYRDRDYKPWQCGYLIALHDAGFLFKQQLPAEHASVAPWERYPDRHGIMRTSSRYWLCTAVARAHDDDDDDQAALHELGWWLPDEVLVRAIRTAAGWRWAERHVARGPRPG